MREKKIGGCWHKDQTEEKPRLPQLVQGLVWKPLPGLPRKKVRLRVNHKTPCRHGGDSQNNPCAMSAHSCPPEGIEGTYNQAHVVSAPIGRSALIRFSTDPWSRPSGE